MYVLLQKALEIDPDYVPALEWLDIANYFREEEGVMSKEDKQAAYRDIKQRVLGLDPGNAVIVAYDAWDAANVSGNLEKAARLYEDALGKDASHSNIVRLAGGFARRIGNIDQAIRLGKHSVAIDPLCYMCLYHLSRTYMYAGQYDRAAEMRERFLVISEAGGQQHYALMMILSGDPQAAVDYLNQLEDPDQFRFVTSRAMAIYDLGDVATARALLDEVISRVSTAHEHELVAQLAGWIGENDLAFEWLDRARDAGQLGARDIFRPEYTRLYDDPRWPEWRASIGMSEERLAALNFNPELPE